jgi:hydroxybutyrate-dimer hydrolase
VDFLDGPLRETTHHGDDDLLSAGLGLAGLRGPPPAFADAAAPTPAELRRRAIQTAWKGIADLGPLGRYGELYGGADSVAGREYHAFARIAGARSPHRVLAQIPDRFDANARCLIVTASPGSRGIYGGIAFAGAWGLRHGCAVAYTDKGCGSGYFDTASATGVALDGTRAAIGGVPLEFVADGYTSESGIAIKHAHSGDNPEAHWGQHVLQAAAFGLAMLDRAFPQAAPFTAGNTRIIAVGVSNGGGAVLQAAGIDDAAWLAGVVAIEPNVSAPQADSGSHARALYDYASEAALLLPCALTDARFDATPFARMPNNAALWKMRGSTLHDAGILQASEAKAQAAEALDRLHAGGWTDAALASAASTTAFDIWRALGATYASAYTRSGVGRMPCGFRFDLLDGVGKSRAATPEERVAWWADAAGIAPGAGIFVSETLSGTAADVSWRGVSCLRELWTGDSDAAMRLRESVQAVQVRLPRKDLPIFIVHGIEDGLLPAAFTSDAYVAWLRANQQDACYWPVAHAQHFDAFLALPGFGDRYVPMLPYAYLALERMYQHVINAAPLDPGPVPSATPRGTGALDAARLGFSPGD